MDGAEWGGLAIGAAFAGLGLVLVCLPWRLRVHGRRAIGVVELEDDGGSAVVVFRTTEGDEQRLASSLDDLAGAIDVGQRVNVVYDPAHPEGAVPEVLLGIRRAFGTLFLLTGGLILLMVSAFVIGFF